MGTLVSIHQPHYWPWLGLLAKIAQSDIHVILDHVDFNKRSYQHRTLYSMNGKPQYLSLSVHGPSGTAIKDVKLAKEKCLQKHYQTLQSRYGRSLRWKEVEPKLKEIYLEEPASMLNINRRTLELTMEVFKIHTQIRYSSEFDCREHKGSMIFEIMKHFPESTYLCGQGAREYMEQASSENASPITFQDFAHPTYDQNQKNHSFVPGCLALEWYLMHGDDAVADFRKMVEGT